jgi:hypothetical protein
MPESPVRGSAPTSAGVTRCWCRSNGTAVRGALPERGCSHHVNGTWPAVPGRPPRHGPGDRCAGCRPPGARNSVLPGCRRGCATHCSRRETRPSTDRTSDPGSGFRDLSTAPALTEVRTRDGGVDALPNAPSRPQGPVRGDPFRPVRDRRRHRATTGSAMLDTSHTYVYIWSHW